MNDCLLRLGDDSQPLGTIIGAMKSHTTRQWWKAGHQGMLWQENFYERIVRKSEDAADYVRYILANPERAGVVKEGSTYRWMGTPDLM